MFLLFKISNSIRCSLILNTPVFREDVIRDNKKSKFSESQIIKILSQQEPGQSVSDICREHGINQGTFYSWNSKYSGMEVSQLKQLREMEKDQAQYRKIVAEQTLKITVLKDVLIICPMKRPSMFPITLYQWRQSSLLKE